MEDRILLARLAVRARCGELGFPVPAREDLRCSLFGSAIHLACDELTATVTVPPDPRTLAVTIYRTEPGPAS